jgi:hypothetical protein
VAIQNGLQKGKKDNGMRIDHIEMFKTDYLMQFNEKIVRELIARKEQYYTCSEDNNPVDYVFCGTFFGIMLYAKNKEDKEKLNKMIAFMGSSPFGLQL